MSFVRCCFLMFYMIFGGTFLACVVRYVRANTRFEKNDWSAAMTILGVFLFFGSIPFLCHNSIEAEYLLSIENKKAKIELNMITAPEEALPAYQKELDKINVRIESEKKALTMKEWDYYRDLLNINKEEVK